LQVNLDRIYTINRIFLASYLPILSILLILSEGFYAVVSFSIKLAAPVNRPGLSAET